jgi:aspartyl-tRNA(Asn)/glutamyl-tRNA(Gln) amidotransferase subunit A
MQLPRTIAEARKKLDTQEYSAVDLAQAYITAIAEKNDELHAYLEVYDDVLAQAKKADALIAAGKATLLTGIPIALKDNFLWKGKKASAASKMLEHYTATYTATAVQKLEDAGAVFLGRANMDEFAMGSSTENSAYGVTKNPHDTSRVPGGSSGGSAAAVAAGLALAALGSDTGGSIRQPSSLCGVVGLKPTYGSISRHGLMAMGSSLDCVGSFGNTVADAAALFDVMQGHDTMDMTSLPDTLRIKSEKKEHYTIGVPRSFLAQGVDAGVMERFEATLAALEAAGHNVVDVSLDVLAHALAVYYIIMPAEVSSNMARFDGVRYGLHKKGASGIDTYHTSRAAGFGKEVRRRILLGTHVLSSGYYDAYYGKAMRARRFITQEVEKVLETVDAIATPTAPTPAFKIGEKTSDPLTMYLEDIFTVPANIVGVPAISVPCGTVEREGKHLPIGIQFMGRKTDETTLFAIGEAVEKEQQGA